MRLYYYKSREGNFGDDLNGWLWERLAPGRWSDESDTLFTGIGTIIGNPMPPARRVLVFSSGFGYSPIPSDWGTERWTVGAVRGPLSANILNLPPEAAVADGALLLRVLPEFTVVPELQRQSVVFVPHHASLRRTGWQEACDLAGIELLDPRRDSHAVIHRLANAKLVIAESMHAAIIADAMRVPWIPVASTNHISTFKWLDWAMSLGVSYEPVRLSSPSIDLAMESLGQPYYGEGHYVEPITASAALQHMQRAINAANARGGDFIRRGRKSFWRGLPSKFRKIPGVHGLENKLDARMINRAANQLSTVAQKAGFLSDGATLDSKISALHDRFKSFTNA